MLKMRSILSFLHVFFLSLSPCLSSLVGLFIHGFFPLYSLQKELKPMWYANISLVYDVILSRCLSALFGDSITESQHVSDATMFANVRFCNYICWAFLFYQIWWNFHILLFFLFFPISPIFPLCFLQDSISLYFSFF